MLKSRILQIFIGMFLLPLGLMAQVTTGTITGTVKTKDGKNLEGATITVTHMPSGTVYATVVKKAGNFSLQGLRTGGPFVIKIDYVGLNSEVINDVYLSIGEPYSLNAVLNDKTDKLSDVTVTGVKRKVTVDKTGASTQVNQRMLTSLPTISRSITDFTRVTPQANGNSFAGRDGRYNNIQIDGANLNNNFGLSTDALPGGGAPISIDAIEELSVNISPFDVRQGAFTGAGINAITKSGTNKFKGSVYGLYRDESFNGTKVNKTQLTLTPSTNKVFGANLGGAIIKNKLFFFVSYEQEERSVPGIPWSPTGGSGAGNVSSTHKDSLAKLSNFLKTTYGYETGKFDNFSNFITKSNRFLAKIDWNISKKHKLTAKYSDFTSDDDQQLNGTSLSFAGGANFNVRTATGTTNISRINNNRFGNRSMSFQNSNYRFSNVVRTGTLELNSNFSSKFSNQLLLTYSKIQSTRTFDGGVFPAIDFLNNDGANNYMFAGTDPFSNNNDVINDVASITNNFTYYAGKHTITGGINYEYQRVGNMFMGASQSWYLYNNLNDFITNQAPAGFTLNYSLIPGKSSVYAADMKLGQMSFYLQDEINVNSRFKLILGLRTDQPIYLDQPLENKQISALSFPNANGVLQNYSTGAWPKSKMLFSPRVGFRWDVDGTKDLVVRGGTGVFTGRIPFVWLTNMPQNSAMFQNAATVTSAAQLVNYKFNPNPLHYVGTFPNTAGTFLPQSFVLIDPNFKFPQVWRTNLAFEKQLGNGIALNMEALFTKDINAVAMRNVNELALDSRLVGPDTRQAFSAATNAVRRRYAGVSNAIILENTDRGFTGTFTAGLSKAATKGFYGSIAYNFSMGADVTSNPGSTASSVWANNATVGTQNSLELYNSQFVVPHRIVGNMSYRFEYAKHFATTVGLFFEIANQGNYTFVYNGDVNRDGNNAADLMYVPKNASEIIFVAQAANATSGLTARTAQEQSDAFFQFVENTPYLKSRQGQYAERNGAIMPLFHRVDFRLVQDINFKIGKEKRTIQLTADILNFTNLLSSSLGVRKQVALNNPLRLAGYNAAGQPTFTMTQVGGQLLTSPLQTLNSIASTWGMQLGVRFIF